MKTAIIGCGAVFDQFQLPALKKIKKIPNYFIDINEKVAESYAKKYKAFSSESYLELLDKFDSAIVSVPHYLHAPICRDLLKNKKHVFIEKPLANTVKECDTIIHSVNGSVLSVGLFRRFQSGSKWLKGLLDSGDLGVIKEFHVREGGPYSWPVKTDSFWKKEKSGGGVLIDTGAHTIDQLCWWLGELDVVNYYDNAFGGVESDCTIKLKTKSGAEGTVELSRTRNIGCHAVFKGSKASVKIGLLDNSIIVNQATLLHKKYNGLDPTTCKPQSYVHLFQLQLEAWFNAIEDRNGDIVTGLSARESVSLIEKCYNNRLEWKLPWVQTSV